MSRQATKRANAIDKDFAEVERSAQETQSKFHVVTKNLKLLVPFLHDNVLNNKGDLTEEDRVYFRDQIVPLFEPLKQDMYTLQELFDIYDDDPTEWNQKLADYIVKYPNCLEQAESRYPKKG